MKILVIQHKMIGDVLVSSIICDNLRKAYPNAEIDYLVNNNTVDILKGNPNINNIVIFDGNKQKSIWELLKFAIKIRKDNYDLVIDAYSKLQSWVVSFLSGAKQKISYRKKGRAFIYTDTVPFAESPETYLGLAIERRLSLLEPLKLILDKETTPKLYLSTDEIEKANEAFIEHKIDSSRKTIMISLLGSEEIKTYPLDFMSKVVDYIGTNYNVNILFNYFPKQLEQARKVYNSCSLETQSKIYFDLFGDSLRDYMGLMNNCELIIGNDGGAINMAKALGKSSFIIFSPWIEKKIWATFEDGINHTSVHLKDFHPEIFEGKTEKELKGKALEYYNLFEPNLLLKNLKKFLDTKV